MNHKTAERPLLEVIACNVEDAVAAQEGGADRLELISHFDIGGLTPSLSLVKDVLRAVQIPVRVMLRESEDFCVTNEHEQQRLCKLARELGALPIDGIVCGFLKDNAPDHELLSRVFSCTPSTRVTFHRAFEQLNDPVAAIHELKRHPQIDRILTSGGQATRTASIECLQRCLIAAQPEITILAGGGIDEEFIKQLRAQTNIREFHVGRIAREPATIDGTVSATRVRQLINLCLGHLSDTDAD